MSNYVISWTWLKDFPYKSKEGFEQATCYIGQLMTKHMEFPFRHLKSSAVQSMAIMSWLHERDLSVEDLYDNPDLFRELRITMISLAIGNFPDEPEANQRLINLAQASELILKGLRDDKPWDSIGSELANLPIAV